ncbi:ABC transporter permease [Lactobacillus sp. LL6]|uniref:ABC transporter permease n=1 Tax=Lactobacillus sp. LL6 TaxID=2596827 RepID=UPI001184D778|nr:ABC transporter permease [Lactobacillus sp. LL6]TSO26454.1 ABC transporter permease [Lactobacillus sp. LL6]
MFALIKRNIKIYFSNIPGVIMSCLGALIAFFIYIGFLQENLTSSWKNVVNATKLLDLWMMAGIITIGGITTSFQALGQLVKDRESRKFDDFMLSDIPIIKQYLSYVLSASFISFIMQIFTWIIMGVYFKIVDQVNIPLSAILPGIGFVILGAIAATFMNMVLALFINSSTTFSRLSAILGAAAGFMIATYMPYGTLNDWARNMVKLIPNSYEAASLRSLFLNKLSEKLPVGMRHSMIEYLGIHFKIENYQLTNLDNVIVMIVMILILVIVLSSVIYLNRKGKTKSEGQFSRR